MCNCKTLPSEIITDMLSRLPVKSLCRFKCVSPTWKTIISDPQFVKTHHNRTRKTINNLKYHVEKNIVISNEHNLYSINFADINPAATKLDFPSMEQYHTAYKWVIWSSCDGLLLVSHNDYSNFFLLNPSTREKLPAPALVLNPVTKFTTYLYGVGYDSFANDYKVVSLTHYDTVDEYEFNPERGITVVGVYSQKTNKWRRIQDSHNIPMATCGAPCGVFINGCLHYVCLRMVAGSSGFLIVAFNLSDEIFTEVVPLPASFGTYEYDVTNYSVEVLGSCLCLVYKWSDHRSEFWMMEYGVSESWSKFTIDMHEMPRAQVMCLLVEDEFLVKIKELKRDSESEDKLVVYNSKEPRRDMVVRGLPTEFTYGKTYVESLISPNHTGGSGSRDGSRTPQ